MVEDLSARCAVYQLHDGVVVNIIIAQPSDPAPDWCGLVEIMNGQACDIGWRWDGTQFVGPEVFA